MLSRYLNKHKFSNIFINNNSYNNKYNNISDISFNKVFGESHNVNNTNTSFHYSKFGELSAGSVVCKHGETVVHVAITSNYNSSPSAGFLPLTVDYRFKRHAIGKIPNTVTGKDRFNENDDILAARVIDRSIRPLFPNGFFEELQITATVQSFDGINDPICTAVNGTSLALLRSGVPWNGPIGCVRVAIVNNEFKLNPSFDELKNSSLDLLYAGTEDKALMIETLAYEINEDIFKAAIVFAQKSLVETITVQKNILTNNNNFIDVNDLKTFKIYQTPKELINFIKENYYEQIKSIFQNLTNLPRKIRSKLEGKIIFEIKKVLKENEEFKSLSDVIKDMAIHDVMSDVFRSILLDQSNGSSSQIRRIDNRLDNELRKITCTVDNLPVTHGSSYFERGDTHVLCTATLGSIEDISIDKSYENNITYTKNSLLQYVNENFNLNYDFPTYCTGDIGTNNSNRRMVGHGSLAMKALFPLIPSFLEFPYCIRVTSECTASNGSSSMATVCGASLALMDCGVPIKSPAAGLSIGLITKAGDNEIDKYVLLSDLLGMEDHYGDMDFKIAGTENGITAVQLDVKLPGLPINILNEALDRAKEKRLVILSEMNKVIPQANENTKPNTPKAEIIKFDIERVKFLIGPYGEMTEYIQRTFNVSLYIDAINGTAYIYGLNQKLVVEAKMYVQDIVSVINIGDIVSAEVIDIKDFGLLVKLSRSQEALLHISQISHDKNLIKKPLTELFTIGQRLNVKAILVDKLSGLIKVSRKETLDPILSVPDHIEPYTPDSAEGSTTTFPVNPPVKYSNQYFSSNVVSKQVLEKVNSESNKTTKMTANETKIDNNFYDKAINVNVNTLSNNKNKNTSNIKDSHIISNPKVENSKIVHGEKVIKDTEYQTTTAVNKGKLSNKISNKNSQLYDYISNNNSKDSTTIDLPTELQEEYSDNQTLNNKKVIVMNSDNLELDNLYEFNNISSSSISSKQVGPFAKDEIKASDKNVKVKVFETVTPKTNEGIDVNNNQINDKSISKPVETVDTTINIQSIKSTDNIEVTTLPKRKRGRPKKPIESSEKNIDTPSTVIVESTTKNKIEPTNSNEKISKPKKSEKNENLVVNNDVKTDNSPIQVSNNIIQSNGKETKNFIYTDSKIKLSDDNIQSNEKVAINIISDNSIIQDFQNTERSHDEIIEIDKPIESICNTLEINHAINETNTQVETTIDNIVNTTDRKGDDDDDNTYYSSLKIIIKPKK